MTKDAAPSQGPWIAPDRCMNSRPYARAVDGRRYGHGSIAGRDVTLDRRGRVPSGGIAMDVLDPARIDVSASRAAGEPRRASDRLRAAYHPPATPEPRVTLLVLHAAGYVWSARWARGAAVLDVPGAGCGCEAAGPRSQACQPLAGTDQGLACLRAAVCDLHAVLTAWPRTVGEQFVLVASGVAASGALVALGAGLAAGAGDGDVLRSELLVDLYEGDALHDRVVDDVVPRIAAAVLIDPAGSERDWRDEALGRITTPVALIERRGAALGRRGFVAIRGSDRLHARVNADLAIIELVAALAVRPAGEVFEDAAARPDAFGFSEARRASGAPVEVWPMEVCRSDFALDVIRTVWWTATRPRPRAQRSGADPRAARRRRSASATSGLDTRSSDPA